MTLKELSKAVLKYRAENNLNQKELAKQIGNISNHTIVNIENRNPNIRKISLAKVENFLEKQIGE